MLYQHPNADKKRTDKPQLCNQGKHYTVEAKADEQRKWRGESAKTGIMTWKKEKT